MGLARPPRAWCSWLFKSCSLSQPIFMLYKCNHWIWPWFFFISQEFLFIGKNYHLGSNAKPHSRCHLPRETWALDLAARAPTGPLLGCGVMLTVSPMPVRADPRERQQIPPLGILGGKLSIFLPLSCKASLDAPPHKARGVLTSPSQPRLSPASHLGLC